MLRLVSSRFTRNLDQLQSLGVINSQGDIASRFEYSPRELLNIPLYREAQKADKICLPSSTRTVLTAKCIKNDIREI